MQEEIKTLRSRIESLTGGRVEGLNSNLALPRPSSAAAPLATDNQAESPTMELGITLLERGQYASAREVFLRLERAQPRNVLVWYFGALATGLTSGDWNGEAKQFVEEGSSANAPALLRPPRLTRSSPPVHRSRGSPGSTHSAGKLSTRTVQNEPVSRGPVVVGAEKKEKRQPREPSEQIQHHNAEAYSQPSRLQAP